MCNDIVKDFLYQNNEFKLNFPSTDGFHSYHAWPHMFSTCIFPRSISTTQIFGDLRVAFLRKFVCIPVNLPLI